MGIINKVFGTHSERELKRINSIIDKIESYRPSLMELPEEELKGKTKEFKKRLEEGETLDGSLCSGAGSGKAYPWNGALPRAVDRRRDSASGPYCRNEDW